MAIYSYENKKLGKYFIEEESGAITALAFRRAPKYNKEDYKQTPLIKKAHKQLEDYFKGNLKTFDLPLAPKGTPFQQKVWKALCLVPYGKTATYGDIAKQIGNPKACRAVGMANNKNPIFIIIPCHRIIGANGALTGYGGGLDMKEFLIDLEKASN